MNGSIGEHSLQDAYEKTLEKPKDIVRDDFKNPP